MGEEVVVVLVVVYHTLNKKFPSLSPFHFLISITRASLPPLLLLPTFKTPRKVKRWKEREGGGKRRAAFKLD